MTQDFREARIEKLTKQIEEEMKKERPDIEAIWRWELSIRHMEDYR